MTKSVILAGLVLGVTILSCIVVDNAYAAFDAFMVLTDVKGESKKPGHEGEIDILSWSWGFSSSAVPPSGGDSSAGSGKATFNEMTITKDTDTASVSLLNSCCQGPAIDEVKIFFFDSSKSDAIPYLEWKLTKARVTSYITEGASGDDRSSETITLNFEEFKVTYTTFELGAPTSEESVTFGKRPTRA